MSRQQHLAQLRQEHQDAIERHRRYIATHELIIQILHVLEQKAITEPLAVAQLQELAASLGEPGLIGLCHQTIERLRKPEERNA